MPPLWARAVLQQQAVRPLRLTILLAASGEATFAPTSTTGSATWAGWRRSGLTTCGIFAVRSDEAPLQERGRSLVALSGAEQEPAAQCRRQGPAAPDPSAPG